MKGVVLNRHTSRKGKNDGKYTHEANVKILLKIDNLWESPKRYLWKHGGQYAKDLINGTVITLNQIHQKG